MFARHMNEKCAILIITSDHCLPRPATNSRSNTMKPSCLTTLITIAFLISSPLSAEIVSSSADHYVLKHQAQSELTPEQLWKRLVQPSAWWHPDHTYSGDANNLSLDLQAGGLWREDWEGNSVLHGSVLQVQAPQTLRLNAPFGPLQDIAVNVVWTISLKANQDGTLVTFDEIANGTKISKLDELAEAVNYVKGEAISRLVVKQEN